MKLNKEWKLVIIISLVITLLSQLPLIVGYATQGPDEIFMGIPVHVTDANNHLHWMLQAKDGAILFTNKFTSEDVPGLIFNPYHLVVGNLSRFTGLQIITWYNIIGVLAIFGFLIYLYKFISYFVKDKQTRWIAFLITALGSGFGAFWTLSKAVFDKWIVSSDLWVTDMNVFQSFGHPHFTISMLLILVVLLNGFKAIENNSNKHAVKAGLFGLLLGLIHIFDIVTVAVVLAGWFGYKSYCKHKFLAPQFGKLSLIGAIMSPAALYYAWLVLFNPTYSAWNSLNQTTTPLPFELISGFGLIFFLAIFQIHKERKHLSFLSVWATLNLILVYIPINVQRRFLLGIGIPLSILAAIVIKEDILPLVAKHKFTITAATIIVILSLTTTVYLTTNQIEQLHDTTTSDYSNVKYLSQEEVDAIHWIDQNIDNNKIIVAPLRIGNYIPAQTDNRVYLGHWAQTINFEEKKEEINKLYQGEPNNIVGDVIWNGNGNIMYQNQNIKLTTN